MAKIAKRNSDYEYILTKGEIKYKVFMNTDREKYNEVNQKIRNNGFFCISSKEKTPETSCQCLAFRNLDKEDVLCACGLYFKKARTEEEMKKFITAKHFTSSKEKAILKEKTPEEPTVDEEAV